MGPTLMVLAIGQHGRVDKQIVDRPEHVEVDDIAEADRLLDEIRGRTYVEAQAALLRRAAGLRAGVHDVLLICADVLRTATVGEGTTHIVVGGVANLADDAQAWRRDTLRRLFETLEREQEMLRVLHDVGPTTEDVRVTIGDEHPSTGEWGASIVAAPFKAGESTVGTIGVVGPTRMDYLSAMTAVRAVAKRLSDVATETEH
jgi:heat-inducible transcriptional repressor